MFQGICFSSSLEVLWLLDLWWRKTPKNPGLKIYLSLCVSKMNWRKLTWINVSTIIYIIGLPFHLDEIVSSCWVLSVNIKQLKYMRIGWTKKSNVKFPFRFHTYFINKLMLNETKKHCNGHLILNIYHYITLLIIESYWGNYCLSKHIVSSSLLFAIFLMR